MKKQGYSSIEAKCSQRNWHRACNELICFNHLPGATSAYVLLGASETSSLAAARLVEDRCWPGSGPPWASMAFAGVPLAFSLPQQGVSGREAERSRRRRRAKAVGRHNPE